jgi:hypothetical protein
VERALSDPSLAASAKAMGGMLTEGGGAAAGAEAIENLLNTAKPSA